MNSCGFSISSCVALRTNYLSSSLPRPLIQSRAVADTGLQEEEEGGGVWEGEGRRVVPPFSQKPKLTRVILSNHELTMLCLTSTEEFRQVVKETGTVHVRRLSGKLILTILTITMMMTNIIENHSSSVALLLVQQTLGVCGRRGGRVRG